MNKNSSIVEFDKFKELINILNNSNLFYFIFAGYGLEGKRKKLVREHKDVDLYIYKKDFNKLKKVLFNINYKIYYEVNDLKAFIKKGLKLDVCLLEKKTNFYYCKLRFIEQYIPKELINKIQKTSINGVFFNIAPDEILKKDGINSEYVVDLKYSQRIKVDNNLFNKIIHKKIT